MKHFKIVVILIVCFLLGDHTCKRSCKNEVHLNTRLVHCSENWTQSVELCGNTSLSNCTTNRTSMSLSTVSRNNKTSNRTFPHCKSQVTTLNLTYTIYLIIVAIVAFIGNVIVCFVISKSQKLRSQSVNHLLLSLAISDIMVSVLSLPVKIHVGLHNQEFCMGIEICWFFVYSDILANCSSVTHLLVISIQRFVAIAMPFDIQYILSRGRIDFLIVVVWLYSAVWSLLCTFNWSHPTTVAVSIQKQPMRACQPLNPIYWTAVYVAVFIIPLVVMGLLQLAILRNVKSHTRHMLKLEENAEKVIRMRKREIRVTKTVSIVYAAFTACWLPVCLLTVSAGWCPSCFDRFRKWNEDVFVATFLIFVQMLPPLSSTLNPFIYVISGSDFRRAVKRVLIQRKADGSRMLSHSDYRTTRF